MSQADQKPASQQVQTTALAEIPQLIESAAAQEPVPRSDSQANQEKIALFGDAKRAERYKSCVHWLTVVGVWSLGPVFIISILLRVVIMMLPEKWRWLTDVQLSSFDHFMFTGLIGSLMTQGVQKLRGDSTPRSTDSPND